MGSLGFNLITGPPVLWVSSSRVDEVRALLEDANTTHEFTGGVFGAMATVFGFVSGSYG